MELLKRTYSDVYPRRLRPVYLNFTNRRPNEMGGPVGIDFNLNKSIRQFQWVLIYLYAATLYGAEAVRVQRVLASRDAQGHFRHVEGEELGELEPALGTRFPRALHIAGEAQIDNRALLQAVAMALGQNKVECHWETFVPDGEFPIAGIVVDCRGMGARRIWPQLRGVRGEIIRLHAPEIELHCMLRLLHPRYAVYIIPRAGGRLVIGATSIESDDHSAVSVRGTLELLTSAYSVLPALWR